MAKEQGQGQENLYNEQVKSEFLSQYLEGTQNTYRRIFINSFHMELELGKDLYDFTAHEIQDFLYSLRPLTYASSRTNGRIVSAYIYWAIDTKRKANRYNPLEDAEPEWFNKFVDAHITMRQLYLTEREIQQVEDFCVNAQDAVIIRCIFEGLSGKGASELINLKRTDVDFFNNTVNVERDKPLKVSERCIGLIKEALKQETYLKRNGMMWDAPDNVPRENNLVQNEFVIRNNVTRTDRYKQVDKHTLYRRIEVIRELFTEESAFNTEVDYLSVKNIARSGMIYMGKKLLEERGRLEKSEYLDIADRFAYKGWWRIAEFVNEDLIEEMYYRE